MNRSKTLQDKTKISRGYVILLSILSVLNHIQSNIRGPGGTGLPLHLPSKGFCCLAPLSGLCWTAADGFRRVSQTKTSDVLVKRWKIDPIRGFKFETSKVARASENPKNSES